MRKFLYIFLHSTIPLIFTLFLNAETRKILDENYPEHQWHYVSFTLASWLTTLTKPSFLSFSRRRNGITLRVECEIYFAGKLIKPCVAE